MTKEGFLESLFQEQVAAHIVPDNWMTHQNSILRDQCRTKWLKHGDRNFALFHLMLKVRKSQ